MRCPIFTAATHSHSRELGVPRVDMARRDAGTGVLSGGEGGLKAVLEGCGRPGASGEGRVEVAEVVGIGEGVGFARRVADGAEPCFDGRGKACPAGEPAVGAGERDGERGCGPGGVAAGCGGQRGTGDDLVPMGGESAPAAGIRVAVGAEQAQTAGPGAGDHRERGKSTGILRQ